jgi:hypothetical protein
MRGSGDNVRGIVKEVVTQKLIESPAAVAYMSLVERNKKQMRRGLSFCIHEGVTLRRCNARVDAEHFA